MLKLQASSMNENTPQRQVPRVMLQVFASYVHVTSCYASIKCLELFRDVSGTLPAEGSLAWRMISFVPSAFNSSVHVILVHLRYLLKP